MSDPNPWMAYVGCRTTVERKASGRGLAVFRLNEQGDWTQVQLVEGLRNPSFLCLHPTRPRLYAVHGDFSELSSFAIDARGLLTKVGEQGTHGFNPVHVALTPSSRWLLVANYASGNLATMRLSEDGTPGSVAHVMRLPGEQGPHAEQGGPHPHQVCFAPDGRHALVPDKGLDAVFTLCVNEYTGRLTIVARSAMPAGSGPRHLAVDAERSLAYVVGELDRTVLTARYDGASDRLELVGACSSVPAGVFRGSAAGIVLSRDRCHLFVSNRGHDSVAVYPIGAAGELGAARWFATGSTPRFISQAPAGDSLIVACEDGHSIAALHGAEPPFRELAQTASPVCIVFRKVTP